MLISVYLTPIFKGVAFVSLLEPSTTVLVGSSLECNFPGQVSQDLSSVEQVWCPSEASEDLSSVGTSEVDQRCPSRQGVVRSFLSKACERQVGSIVWLFSQVANK